MDEAEFRSGIRDRRGPAWERLERLYGQTLRRQASLILPAGMDPDNAVGEVWVRALQSAGSYDPALSPFPWLARICSRTCLNQRRGERRERRRGHGWGLLHFVPGFLLDDPPAPARPSTGASAEARSALRAALRAIPRKEREVVSLRFLFEVSEAEMAGLLGVQPKSIRRTLIRGLDRLRTGEMATELEGWMTALERGM